MRAQLTRINVDLDTPRSLLNYLNNRNQPQTGEIKQEANHTVPSIMDGCPVCGDQEGSQGNCPQGCIRNY